MRRVVGLEPKMAIAIQPHPKPATPEVAHNMGRVRMVLHPATPPRAWRMRSAARARPRHPRQDPNRSLKGAGLKALKDPYSRYIPLSEVRSS